MLTTVAIGDLKPNPFRRLDEYPIQREKVDALKESIESTGFWGTIVARPAGSAYEIAFGHHRLVALRETRGPKGQAEVIVRDLTNEQMLKMMAKENMEEWGTSAWVELETVRAVIDAFGKGEIELPAVPTKTPEKHVRLASDEHRYTRDSVATFLGWTKKDNNGVRPNAACESAFDALDLIGEGLLPEKELKGLSRAQLRAVVESANAIKRAHEREAAENARRAEAAQKAAREAASQEERRREEKKAQVFKEQEKYAKADAKKKTQQDAKASADQLRNGDGLKSVRNEAERYKPTSSAPAIPSVEKHARKLVTLIHNIAHGDDNLSAGFELLVKEADPAQLPDATARELDAELAGLVARLGEWRRKLKAFRSW
jgi:flagellar biosynthesis GTPase FlhF